MIFYMRNNENKCKNNPYGSEVESFRFFLQRKDDLFSRKIIFLASVFTCPSIPMAKKAINWIRILIGRKI